MKKFINICNIIKNTIPKSTLKQSRWYILQDKPAYTIQISQPDNFNNYSDIVARITLYFKDTILWDVLVAQDTDYDKFGQKLLEKIHKHWSCIGRAQNYI